MTRKIKNVLIILCVILEAGIGLAFGFAVTPVSKPVCLLLWCLLSFLICRLAEDHPSHIRRRGPAHPAA